MANVEDPSCNNCRFRIENKCYWYFHTHKVDDMDDLLDSCEEWKRRE